MKTRPLQARRNSSKESRQGRRLLRALAGPWEGGLGPGGLAAFSDPGTGLARSLCWPLTKDPGAALLVACSTLHCLLSVHSCPGASSTAANLCHSAFLPMLVNVKVTKVFAISCAIQPPPYAVWQWGVLQACGFGSYSRSSPGQVFQHHP